MTPADLAAVIRAALITVLTDRGADISLVPETVTVERPRNPEHGDYATNIALQLGKKVGVAPRDLAGDLATALVADAGIESAEIAGPGFLNIRLDSGAQGSLVSTVLAKGVDYGAGDALSGRRVNLEFVSANPTGPIHLGGTRWAAVGDALGRVLEASGAEVTREYYFNDHGAQIDRFSTSLAAAAKGEPTPEDGYAGAYIEDIAARIVAEHPDVLDKPEAESLEIFRSVGVDMMFSHIKSSLADFGTPIIIGGRFSTLAADIYLQVVGYSDLEKSSAMNMFLLIPSIVFFFVYRALMRRSDRLTDASRTAQTELGLLLPHCGAMGWGMIALSTVFFVMIVLQYGCVFLSGFLKSTKGVYSFTLQYWDQLWRIGSSTMLRSVEYALIVSIAGTVFAMLFAYYMDRRRIIGRSLFDCLATLPYMLPGTCFGIGYILAFNHAPLKLTGTALIVLANMLFKQLPTSTKICTASLALLPEVQERSARDLGAGRLAVLRDVVFPALRPAFLSCFVYNFTSSMTTAGSIIFLIDAKRQLAVFKLFDAVYQGDYALASLIASVITVIVLLVEGLAFLITRKGENRRVSRT